MAGCGRRCRDEGEGGLRKAFPSSERLNLWALNPPKKKDDEEEGFNDGESEELKPCTWN